MNATGTRKDFRQSYADFDDLGSRESLTNLVPRLDFTLSPPTDTKLPFQGFLVSLAYFSDDTGGDFTSFSGQQVLEEYRLDFRDTYDTSGLLLPAPGYGGTLAGPGVTIPNLPAQRDSTETLTGSEIATLRNVVSLDLDLSNLSLAIGPTLEGSFAPNWQWQASFGPTFNFYRYTFRQSEQVYGTLGGTTSPAGPGLRDNESGSEFGIGLFLRGSLAHQLTENWQITSYLQAEYAESFRISNGVSSFKVEPAGYSIGLGVGHTF